MDAMTPQKIKRAYDEAVAEVLEEHRARIAEIINGTQKSKDRTQLEAVRARLNDPLS